MEMTSEEREIYDGLNEAQKAFMESNALVLKYTSVNEPLDGYVPPWITKEVKRLKENGFEVSEEITENEIYVESDISKATFAQKIMLLDLDLRR